ncbi:hypothetical protein IKE87_02375 [Candidatus Saccharibacteria bacterium]|nr:hypothetical protein [Candidatus Saccharibacteria bacterium]
MAQAQNDISWEAEEYVTRKHNGLWYFGLFLITAGLSALAIFLRWWTFLALVILSAITILVLTFRPPRKISYTLTKTGLKEDKVLHKFSDYRAFGIMKEGTHFSAILIPKKRIAMSTKVYFPGSSGEVIVDYLGARLPMEEVKLDFLDKIVNFLRI